jgi:hypothetical protein
LAIAFGKNPALRAGTCDPDDPDPTPDSVVDFSAVSSRDRLAGPSRPQSSRSRSQSPDVLVASMAAVANRWAGRWGGREGAAAPPTTTQPAPSRMYHCAPAPLDMHGSDMDGAARPWRLSRGDPRGRGDRGARSSGDRGARSSGGECTDGAAAPAEAARALPTAGGGAAWAAAVAEAEKEKEAESRGLVSSEGSRDDAVASRLSSGELSPDLLQTLMRMQDTHEAARERRRVRHTGSGGDVIGDVGSSGDTGSSADTPAAFPPLPPPPTQPSPMVAETTFPGLSLQSMEEDRHSSCDSDSGGAHPPAEW